VNPQTAPVQPTEQDLENARVLREIADRQQAEYDEAALLALGALGPGWTPWMKLVLVDADHRRSGNTTPVATAYQVCRGEKRLSENSLYLRRMPDGAVKKAESYEPLFGELLTENHPTYTMEVRGERVAVDRYELWWAALECYRPRSAEELAALRVSREQKKIEREEKKWAEENPLLAWAGLRGPEM
jgi:hypothetical protein